MKPFTLNNTPHRRSLARVLGALSLAAACGPALAIDGTLTFTATVSAFTCTIKASPGTTVTGSTPDLSLSLGSWATANLNADGKTSASTAFNINFSGCTLSGAGGTVTTGFSQQPGTYLATGVTNLVVEILGSDGSSSINLSQAPGNQGVTPITGPAGGTQQFYARLRASSGAASAGNVSKALTYFVIYT